MSLTTDSRIQRALGCARACVRYPSVRTKPDEITRSRSLAIGDPQAPIERFMAILAHNELLGDDGWLADDVYLLSMGDHFDYGPSAERQRVADSATQLLSWLAAHAPDQVSLIVGNHDLARIGELEGLDDAQFLAAHEMATAAYRDGDIDAAAQVAFLDRYPQFPTAEAAARDFSGFHSAQRKLVLDLLRAGRFPIAIALAPDTLACHAGVTIRQLKRLGLNERQYSDAYAIANALDRALEQALDHWLTRSAVDAPHGAAGKPFRIPGLHEPGSRDTGEGGGMFYHRPCHPDVGTAQEPLGRRYDPRQLPAGLLQIIGHINDPKCIRLLGPWAGAPAIPGALRHLCTDGAHVRYRPGLPDAVSGDIATLVFTDGRMAHTSPEAFELLDLNALARIRGL